jgi:FkbM family methyltransferase
MSRLKLYAHTRLPKRAVSWLEAVRRRSYKGNPSTRPAHFRFVQLNEPRELGLITMREGIQFFTHDESFDSFQWFCWRSPEMIDEYDQFVSDCQGKSTLLDVGACHGAYSLTFLSVNSESRAIAVEPSPAAREILEYNIAANCLRNRIEIVSHAAGENDGTMYAMPNWHHLEAKKDSRGAVAVGTRSVDAMCDEHACRPDLIKIDVEGFELYVLQGARRVLSRRPVVYLEIHPQLTAKLGYDHTKCFDLMSQMDYEITEVNGRLMTRKEFWQRHHTFFTVCR